MMNISAAVTFCMNVPLTLEQSFIEKFFSFDIGSDVNLFIINYVTPSHCSTLIVSRCTFLLTSSEKKDGSKRRPKSTKHLSS